MNTLAFVLGASIILFVWGLVSWKSKIKIKLSWLSWLGMILAALLALFTIAWLITSIIEGEIQAAGMGLLIFGILTFIAIALTRKRIIKDNRIKSSKRNESKD
jgi:hypothetical protein